MTGNKQFDARRMFRHACGFADCAYFCEREPQSIVVRTQWYTIPGITNSAFACEIYLKAMLVFHGMSLVDIKMLNHGLKGLWSALKEKDVDFEEQVRSRVLGFYRCPKETFFDESMDNISAAFNQWRYIYEGHGATINLQFLRIFREVLRTVCCEKLYGMTWAEYEGRN